MRDFTIAEELPGHFDSMLSKRLLLFVERVVDHMGGIKRDGELNSLKFNFYIGRGNEVTLSDYCLGGWIR
jgi:hypothetical protein